ncbi:MAG: restriction endonuclease subunit S [Butyrivibrio sp.]|nr:restriction endonuclease subunit S [Butyrivibrio sp.]
MDSIPKNPSLRFYGFTDDWEQRKCKELCSIGTGKSNTQDQVDGGEYPFFIRSDKAVRSNKYLYDEEAVITIGDGNIGRVFHYINGKFDLHQRCYKMADFKDVTAKYFYYFFSKNFYKRAMSMTAKATVDSVRLEMIADMDIQFPSDIMEQRLIADYFTNLDNLITLHQRKYDKLVNIKRSMMEKMFPQNGSEFPEIRFNGFTEAWEQRKFASVFDGLQNNTLSRAELNYESGTVRNVHYGDVLIKFGDYIDASKTELPYISDDTKADKFKNSFLQDGDIIIADTAEDDTVGKCTEIQGSGGLKLLSGLHTIACRPKEKHGPMFLGYYINSPAYHNQLKPLMQGIKVTSISRSALQDTDMIMPKSIDEQIKIGEYFSNLDNLITLHQRKLEKLKVIKKSMLDNMFV